MARRRVSGAYRTYLRWRFWFGNPRFLWLTYAIDPWCQAILTGLVDSVLPHVIKPETSQPHRNRNLVDLNQLPRDIPFQRVSSWLREGSTDRPARSVKMSEDMTAAPTLDSNKMQGLFDLPGDCLVSSLALTPDGCYIFAAFGGGEVRLYAQALRTVGAAKRNGTIVAHIKSKVSGE